jgi:aralkylamine N-acetyltransferase
VEAAQKLHLEPDRVFQSLVVQTLACAMEPTYSFSCHGLDIVQLERLFEAARLGGRRGDKILRAFLNSSLVCFARHGDRLIGASRALSDGEYHALIYDVVVHPEYQRHGIGSTMLRELLGRLPVWRVMLVAGEEVQPFYQRFGFRANPEVMALLDWNRLYDDDERGSVPEPS